jgi:hypothetical protein
MLLTDEVESKQVRIDHILAQTDADHATNAEMSKRFFLLLHRLANDISTPEEKSELYTVLLPEFEAYCSRVAHRSREIHAIREE